MEPSLFEQISKKIEELKLLLDQANAKALSAEQVSGRQKLPEKVNAVVNSTLQTLQVSKPTLYTDKINRQELTDLKRTYDAIPDLVRDINTCAKKAEGWKISTGQNINGIILHLYDLLSTDVKRNPDLVEFHNSLAKLFKLGKRKPKPDGKNSSNKDASDGSNTSSGDTSTGN